MNRYILEEFHNDPAVRRRLFEKAHRERNRAIRAGLAWLFAQVKVRLAPRIPRRPARWLARLG